MRSGNQGGLRGGDVTGFKTSMTRRAQLWKLRGNILPGRENNKCKGPEAGRSLAGFKNQKKAYEAESQ